MKDTSCTESELYVIMDANEEYFIDYITQYGWYESCKLVQDIGDASKFCTEDDAVYVAKMVESKLNVKTIIKKCTTTVTIKLSKIL